jgi:hypothetical protein
MNDHDVIDTMILLGGGFVSSLGRLYRQADADNQRRLREAFPEYWVRYRELAELRTARAVTSQERG